MSYRIETGIQIWVNRMAEHPEQIHPDAARATADILEQISQMGLIPTMIHIEEAGFSESGQHFIVNIDAVQADHEPAEHPDAMQRVLNDVGSDHADELAVAAPEAPMYPEEGGPAYWDLEAMVRIQQAPGK